MEKDYDEEVEEIDDELEELTEEELELCEIEKEQSTKVENGKVKFANVDHSSRANKMGRISDTQRKNSDTQKGRNITKYCNVALEYFGYRCALSGERFVSFNEKVEGKKSNLSAEHIIALAIGGNDIVPNLAPTVWEYNRIKNGYYILDYWDKQKDIEGKSLYTPYRLLKLVNYMMKSIEAREDVINDRYRAYKKKIMTPNEIDDFLAEIEKQDELEPDNNKKKIHSDTITATTEDADNKKILTRVPLAEGCIMIQDEQPSIDKEFKVDMMSIFLADAVALLKREQELQRIQLKDKDGNEISLQDQLDEMLEKSVNIISFEIEVRNTILEKLESKGIQNNKYSVANDLLNNTPILEMANEKRENLKSIVDDYFENQLLRIRKAEILSEEQLKTAISTMPTILYNEKEINKIKLWSTYRSESFEELISGNYTATDTIIDVFIVLKTNGIDLSEIIIGGKNSTTIEYLIKEKDEEEQKKIINELQEISKEITKDWPIGNRLRNQKSRNIEELEEEIEKAGIPLTAEEKQKILEPIKGITTREFVQVLVVLKKNEVNLSKIIQGVDSSSTIEYLIKEKNEDEQNKIINELQKISEEITTDWLIGSKLKSEKQNMEKLKEEIEKAGLELTEEEKQKILGKESREEFSKRKTREFVQVLVVLKKNEINLSKIIQGVDSSSTIEYLIKEKNEEEQDKIINELQKISKEITKDWLIGNRLTTQKKKIEQLKEEIEKAGLELTEEEQQNILGKESSQELNKRKTREFVHVLLVLKINGIDLSKIIQSAESLNTIEDLIKEKNEEEQNKILNELQKISKEITKDWLIGVRLNIQKRNVEQLEEEIEKAGLELTEDEQQKILGKESREEFSKRTTREFVQILLVLKINGINLAKIARNGTIEETIKGNDEEEQNKILSELQKISKEITKDWSIGNRLSVQKKNIKQLKEEIEKAGLELGFEEQQRILEKESNQEKSERTIRKVVQVLLVLKRNGIDLSKIVQTGKIEDVIKEKDEVEQNKIINELQKVSKEITRNWPIGQNLMNQKKRNLDKLKEEIKELGLEEKLTDKERKKLLEKRSQKKVKQTVVEQKNKGELGQNQRIEAEIFEETIRQAEQTQETETSAR